MRLEKNILKEHMHKCKKLFYSEINCLIYMFLFSVFGAYRSELIKILTFIFSIFC